MYPKFAVNGGLSDTLDCILVLREHKYLSTREARRDNSDMPQATDKYAGRSGKVSITMLTDT
jgi:hypothetical protein